MYYGIENEMENLAPPDASVDSIGVVSLGLPRRTFFFFHGLPRRTCGSANEEERNETLSAGELVKTPRTTMESDAGILKSKTAPEVAARWYMY